MSTLNNKVFTKPKHYNFWDVSVFADNMIYIHRQSKYADINESLLTLTCPCCKNASPSLISCSQTSELPLSIITCARLHLICFLSS